MAVLADSDVSVDMIESYLKQSIRCFQYAGDKALELRAKTCYDVEQELLKETTDYNAVVVKDEVQLADLLHRSLSLSISSRKIEQLCDHILLLIEKVSNNEAKYFTQEIMNKVLKNVGSSSNSR